MGETAFRKHLHRHMGLPDRRRRQTIVNDEGDDPSDDSDIDNFGQEWESGFDSDLVLD